MTTPLPDAPSGFNVELDLLPIMLWRAGPDMRCTYVNRAAREFTGRSLDAAVGEIWFDGIHPDDRSRVSAGFRRAFDVRESFALDLRVRRHDGKYRWVRAAGAPSFDPGGTFTGYIATYVDVHAETLARESAREETKRLALLIDQSPVAICALDTEMRYLAASERWRESYGLGQQVLLGRCHYDVFPELPEAWRAVHRRCLAGATESGDEDEYVRADGRREWIRWEVRPWRDPTGAIGGLLICTENLTARVEAVAKLRESEERFRQMADAVEEVFWMTDPTKGTVLYINPAYEKIWGRPREELFANAHSWMEAIEPDDRERIRLASAKQSDGTYDEEYRIRRPDGTVRHIRDRAFPIRDASGAVYRIAGVADDVTDRRALGEQLRQAQKMEAVGQLAGGVAHDFNNTLTIIQANVQLMLEDATLTPLVVEQLNDIGAAADRAATLTKQLLVFSRRQPTKTRTVDLNACVSRAGHLLARLLPENVVLETRLASGPLSVRADAAMIEQVVLNLAINSRDAMPRGGALLIATSRVGERVVLSVTDEGVGIEPAHLPRVFEPFFTTKDVGQGTGLGLATVHGTVTQHNGTIEVESEVGRGTAFRVTLPAAEPVDADDEPAPVSVRESYGRTILVVEDDAKVRGLARRILERSGYRVREAGNAAEALETWGASADSIDLLLTDVVMPGPMSGLDLAGHLRESRPSLPVVFTSGYSEEFVAAPSTVREGENYLPKPYQVNALLAIVARALAPRTTT